jgi:hypothetical protein
MSIRRRQPGYVLMEAILALVLVSVGLLGITRAFHQSMAASYHAAAMSQASRLAQEKLTDLRVALQPSIGERHGDFAAEDSRFHWRTVVLPVDHEAYYSILVEVSWQEQGILKSVSLGSLLAGVKAVGA